MSNHSSKRDANHGEIVRALLAVGCTVVDLHAVGKGAPDLLVGRKGLNYLLEVKAGRGQLSDGQLEWHQTWFGQVTTVRTVDEAWRAVGMLKEAA